MHRGGVFSHLWPLNRCRGQPTDSELLYLCHHFAGLGLEIAPPPLCIYGTPLQVGFRHPTNCYGISPTPRLCGLWLFIINVPLFSTANSPEPGGPRNPVYIYARALAHFTSLFNRSYSSPVLL